MVLGKFWTFKSAKRKHLSEKFDENKHLKLTFFYFFTIPRGKQTYVKVFRDECIFFFLLGKIPNFRTSCYDSERSISMCLKFLGMFFFSHFRKSKIYEEPCSYAHNDKEHNVMQMSQYAVINHSNKLLSLYFPKRDMCTYRLDMIPLP